jgi:hypothetical protein
MRNKRRRRPFIGACMVRRRSAMRGSAGAGANHRQQLPAELSDE